MVELRARPSLLDDIATDRGCPVSAPQRVQGTDLQALGGEPLYATGVNAVTQWDALVERGDGRYLEVTWLRLPLERLPVLIRGAKVNDSAPLDFVSTDGESSQELYLSTETSSEAETVGPDYRMWTSFVRVPGPGCYGFQVEGIGHFGGYTIILEVS